VQADLRNEKIGYKIREHTLQRVPYLLVVGEKERADLSVAVRARSGEDKGSRPLAEVVDALAAEVANRGHCV
jgi:threonyl-tRNA synthetase